MNKTTKQLFARLKELRPIVDGISHDYGTDDRDGTLVEKWYLHIPNKYIPFSTEIDLQNKIKELTASTETDLGFRLPNTNKKFPNIVK